MRKICYVMTVVSKRTFFFLSWGSMCEMWFPMQPYLKKENKKDIAADSLYRTVFVVEFWSSV